MVGTFNALEVGDGGANHVSGDLGTGIRAGYVACAGEHRDGNFVDSSDVDQIRLAMTGKVVLQGNELLEPVGIGVLLPVERALNRHWLASGAIAKATASVTQLLADAWILLIPVRSILVVDADRWELVDRVLIEAFWSIRRVGKARGESEDFIKVVSKERLLKVR